MAVLTLPLLVALLATLAPAAPARATTETTAETAMAAYVDAFWDPDEQYFTTYSDGRPRGGVGPENGTYSDFWWEARLWEVVMDAWESTGDPEYRAMVDQVFDGFVAHYPDFGSDFNDDVNWWAMGAARAYEITGDERYLETSQQLFARIWADRDETYGGGIWWRHSVQDQKNVATNAPAALTAVRLARHTGDEAYLDRAVELFTWVDEALVDDDGHVHDHWEGEDTLVRWDFTYNFGTYISAATALYEETGDQTYLDKALLAAVWVTTRLTNGGTFRDEGIGDGGGFKSLLVRALVDLVQRHGQEQYLEQLQDNATQAWNHRRSDGLMGPDWSAPTSSGPLQSLAASSGLTAVLLVPPDGVRGVLAESGVYEAENASVVGIDLEATSPGWTGRGYLAGWGQDGEQVTFHVNVARAGRHTVTLRYAGDDGDATRMVMLNSRVWDVSVDFPETGGWDRWTTQEISLPLSKGHNSIQIRLDEASDNLAHLNLDRIELTRP
ncbi:hypothetical protein DT076_05955 [Desertihabitans brevis]|uniref:CBM6 domain-containing protein n=1 Tax=Desertihabitans brevis TaxID=2268447 RepID=A0A367YWG2_9ACTN|nr:hypothetical protein DT076_05955 [Desertihabitans brevis]